MAIRRMKTYAGGQGCVYQYYYVGNRSVPAKATQEAAIEYIFDVTSDRKTTFAVSVFLPSNAVQTWAVRHRRPLTEAEQYAAVKMRLFGAFDEVEDLMAQGRQLWVDSEILEKALTTLGVD
ncbi:MAG: hypothetical protein ACLP6G_03075 [Terriglobales bacterium]